MRTVRQKARDQSGSTLAELVVATALVGVLMTAALTSTGQSLVSQRKSADQAIGRHLAEALLAEIQTKAYTEPDAVLPLVGLDLGETLGLSGSYDDVDDFDNYSESPPKTSSGTTMSQYPGWSRSVQVGWIDAATLAPTSSTGTGIKRITVTAKFNGVTMSTVQGHKVEAP